MATYKFVDDFDKPQNNEETESFLQMTSFMHPKTKLYHVRKFNITQTNDLINMKDYYLSKRKYDKLLKKRKPNTYKIYAVYSLNDVNYPNMSDILDMRSTILQSNHDYYGFAPF